MITHEAKGDGEFALGEVAGLRISMGRSSIAASLLLWGLAALAGRRLARFTVPTAAVGGLLAVLLHWAAELVHQLGHARAAASTGYPMTGIRFWGVFGRSEYPADEPELPAAIHVRRALGGPPVTMAVGLLALPFALKARRGSLLQAVAALVLLENFFVFGLGAFVPLGFTDGSTLLRWLPRLRKEREETTV